MSKQTPQDPNQDFTINESSIKDSQIGGQAGRDLHQAGGDLYVDQREIHIHRGPAHLTRQDNRNRQALLNKVKKHWIKGVLEKSLAHYSPVTLGLTIKPKAVTSPWDTQLMADDNTDESQSLPEGTQVISIFDDLGEGRTLLILGEPGSGKTTTLLQLTSELIERALNNPESRIPVVLHLSSWLGEKQTLVDWIVEELNTKYQVPKPVGKKWINTDQLLLMLDGLDEIRAADREACVIALNDFLRNYNPEIVVCSRLRDYESLTNHLKFGSAICLRSLTPKQMHDYLEHADENLTGLNSLLDLDLVIQELASSPLMLNMMAKTYEGKPLKELSKNLLIEDHHHQILETYVEKMFRYRGEKSQYTKEQTISWLHWLAKMMTEKTQSVFLIERLQPSWLSSSRQRKKYRVCTAVFVGISFGLCYGLTSQLGLGLIRHGLTAQLVAPFINGLIMATIIGLIVGIVIFNLSGKIKTVETLQWSWRKTTKNAVFWGLIGFSIGLIGGWIVDVVYNLVLGGGLGLSGEPLWKNLIMRFLLFDGVLGLIAGLIYGLTCGLGGSEVELKTMPNQAIWRSAISARNFCLLGGVMGGLLGGLSAYLMSSVDMSDGIISGLSLGTVFGLMGGGGVACARHIVLRAILYAQGAIPWNYARFLDYATEHILLRKVGGSYIFVHRVLLDYFAQIKQSQ